MTNGHDMSHLDVTVWVRGQNNNNKKKCTVQETIDT